MLKGGWAALAYYKDRKHGDICIYCKRINVDGTWKEPIAIDIKFTPLELKSTICPNCTFERFPKFYVSDHSSNDRSTKRIVSKTFSFFKRNFIKE
jgi:hypothetical protein